MCKNEKCSSLKQPRASTFVGYNRPKIFFLRVCQKRLMSYFWCIYKHGVGNISYPSGSVGDQILLPSWSQLVPSVCLFIAPFLISRPFKILLTPATGMVGRFWTRTCSCCPDNSLAVSLLHFHHSPLGIEIVQLSLDQKLSDRKFCILLSI